MRQLRNTIKKNLPKGFRECINYGMIGYVVPHSKYPGGYHCRPEDPLPFLNIASQKNCISVYHMGLYVDKKLMNWFLDAYMRTGLGKPDMGKSCIRFKKTEQIPFELIGQLASKMTVDAWIKLYETSFRRKGSGK